MGGRAISLWTTVLVLGGGCFASSDPIGAGGTTDAACPNGSVGCACYGNGTCDEGLVCSADAGFCVHAGDCTPGTLGCGCDAGTCTDGSVCLGDYCGMGGSESGTAASTLATSADPTTGVDPSTTGTSADAGTLPTTTSAGEASSSDSSGGNAETSSPGMCGQCLLESAENPCKGAYDECKSIPACGMMLDELETCLDLRTAPSECIAMACEPCPNGTVTEGCTAYEMTADCVSVECGAFCPDLGCD